MDGYLLDATAESDRWIDRQTDRHRDSERERDTWETSTEEDLCV